MGVHPSISYDRFPKQGEWLHRRVMVCFNYDASRTIGGTIVRFDVDEPGHGIIALDDNRHVLLTECQYSLEAAPVGSAN